MKFKLSMKPKPHDIRFRLHLSISSDIPSAEPQDISPEIKVSRKI